MICPFRYMFNKWGRTDAECLKEECGGWSKELQSCSFVLPFQEFTKELINEKQEQT